MDSTKFKADPTWLKKTVQNSSQISTVYYDNNNRRLYVVFNKGNVYSYEHVSAQEHRDMINAESIGSYFHKHIKNSKEFNRIQ